MLLRREFVLAGLVVFAVPFALGSETNTGTPLYSARPDQGFESISAFSVAIRGGAGNGSGALYTATQSAVAGVNNMFLNVATAAHVVDGNNGYSMNLHMGNTIVTLNAGNATFSTLDRGAGAYFLPEDMAWMGVQISQNAVDNNTWQFLTGLTAVNGMIASALPGVNAQLTNYGFGLSGRYLYDDFDPVANTHSSIGANTLTPGVQGNGHTFTPLGLNWQNDLPAADQFGTDRLTRTVANGVFVYTDGQYKYDSVQWDFRPDAGTGQINSGDSGGAILNNGSIVGLNTFAFGSTYTFGANGRGEDFFYGTLGGGIAFTPNDITFLNNQARTFVPEPASLIGLGTLLAGVLARRRRGNKES